MKLHNTFASIYKYIVTGLLSFFLLGGSILATTVTFDEYHAFGIGQLTKVTSKKKKERNSSVLSKHLFCKNAIGLSGDSPKITFTGGKYEGGGIAYGRTMIAEFKNHQLTKLFELNVNTGAYEKKDIDVNHYKNALYLQKEEKGGMISHRFFEPEDFSGKYKNIEITKEAKNNNGKIMDQYSKSRLALPAYHILKIGGVEYTKEAFQYMEDIRIDFLKQQYIHLQDISDDPYIGLKRLIYPSVRDIPKHIIVPFEQHIHQLFQERVNFVQKPLYYFCVAWGIRHRTFSGIPWGEFLYSSIFRLPSEIRRIDILQCMFKEGKNYEGVMKAIMNKSVDILEAKKSKTLMHQFFEKLFAPSTLLYLCFTIFMLILTYRTGMDFINWVGGKYQLPYGVKSNLNRPSFVMRALIWLDQSTLHKMGLGISASPIEERYSLDDFVGNEVLIDQVSNLVDTYQYVVKANRKEAARGRSNSQYLNMSNVLLLGPPGTGKTMLTKIIVQMLSEDCNHLVVDSTTLSGMSSKERADFWACIKKHRNPAKPLVVIFNDVDQILLGKSDWHRDFLGLLDKSGDPGYCFVFTTNLPRAEIKQNVLSRIGTEITVLAPDLEASLHILYKNMKNMSRRWGIKLLFDPKDVRNHDYFAADEPPVGRDVLQLVERTLVAVNMRSAAGRDRRRAKALGLAQLESILDDAYRDKLHAYSYDKQLFKDEQQKVKKVARDAAILREDYKQALMEKMGNIAANEQAKLDTASFGQSGGGSSNTMMLVMMMMMTMMMLLGMGGVGFVMYQYITGKNKDDE